MPNVTRIAGAPQIRAPKYDAVPASTSGAAPNRASATTRIAGASTRMASPMPPPSSAARTRTARLSCRSPAPSACAVSPVVDIRRNPKLQ